MYGYHILDEESINTEHVISAGIDARKGIRPLKLFYNARKE